MTTELSESVEAAPELDQQPLIPVEPAAPRGGLLRDVGALTVQTWAISKSLKPLWRLLATDEDVERTELSTALDSFFVALYKHPVTGQTERVTKYLRHRKLIPNEQSTEELIRFVVDQAVARSPVVVPDAIVQEFWQFFDEMFSSPELKGLGELSLDMIRLVVATYEPMLVEIVNLLKAGRRFNQWQSQEIRRRMLVVRGDLVIMQRQIKAIRYIKPFFQTDPKDFSGQAQIVAAMVREFGPFFIKMAQAAASNADFLPEEIAKELAVFHEDVPPMSAEEVEQAFMECYGCMPQERYMDFNADSPIKSGSIGSIYVAKKPFEVNGQEYLVPVVVKVGRHNIDREFVIGKMVLGLAIISSQYWAPHTKLAPFLRAMQDQVDEFVKGFQAELDFEEEARNQRAFFARSRRTQIWQVPALYGSSRRILEMEYLEDATSLIHVLDNRSDADARRVQRRLTSRLLHAVLTHVFFYQEVHGDLHPGNVMVDDNDDLYLIDWGNCVTMDGKWAAVWDYVVGAIVADTELLTNALINISTLPEENAARRDEIRAGLEETLQKKGVVPLTKRNFVKELGRGGLAGLHLRGQTVLHLMSNTQQLGLVVRSEYLHLSRSLFAMAGSFATLYENQSKLLLFRDLLVGLTGMPWRMARDRVDVQVTQWRNTALKWLPGRRNSALKPTITPANLAMALEKAES